MHVRAALGCATCPNAPVSREQTRAIAEQKGRGRFGKPRPVKAATHKRTWQSMLEFLRLFDYLLIAETPLSVNGWQACDFMQGDST
mmetsp:Transcript_119861/g.350388  ORF Transcript_119861/g.350388 Transcript_119861/m.350388 type:complete len:86 (-) Transcript_119861:3-260(-)